MGARHIPLIKADVQKELLSEETQAMAKACCLVADDVVMPEVDSNVIRFGTRESLENTIPSAEVLIVRSQKIDASLLEKAEKLRLIVRQGVGTDSIDADFAKAKGIEVENMPLSTPSVAELTIGFMVMTSRNLTVADAKMKAGSWEKGAFVGNELFCKTLGIVGLGRIGRHVARIAHAMGMKVIYYDPYVEEVAYEKRLCLEDLFSESDVLSFHVPLTNETFHMLNTENVRLLKKGAILINTARGKVIQPEALELALKEKIISSLCLDVHYREPPCYEGLCRYTNVILSPHIGGNTEEALERMKQRTKCILSQKGFK